MYRRPCPRAGRVLNISHLSHSVPTMLTPRYSALIAAALLSLSACSRAPTPAAGPSPPPPRVAVAPPAPLLSLSACSRAPTPAAGPSPALTGVAVAPMAIGPGGWVKEFGTMRTFDAPPLDYWQGAYGFRPTPAWLEHV